MFHSFILCNFRSGPKVFLWKLRTKTIWKNTLPPYSLPKVAYVSMAVGIFFSLCSLACTKQPRTSILFYKFFYPTFSARISDFKPGQIFDGVLLKKLVSDHFTDTLTNGGWSLKTYRCSILHTTYLFIVRECTSIRKTSCGLYMQIWFQFMDFGFHRFLWNNFRSSLSVQQQWK